MDRKASLEEVSFVRPYVCVCELTCETEELGCETETTNKTSDIVPSSRPSSSEDSSSDSMCVSELTCEAEELGWVREWYVTAISFALLLRDLAFFHDVSRSDISRH